MIFYIEWKYPVYDAIVLIEYPRAKEEECRSYKSFRKMMSCMPTSQMTYKNFLFLKHHDRELTCFCDGAICCPWSGKPKPSTQGLPLKTLQ